MARKTKEERERRALEAKERAEKRRLTKKATAAAVNDEAANNVVDGDEQSSPLATTTKTNNDNDDMKHVGLLPKAVDANNNNSNTAHIMVVPLLNLPVDTFARIMRYLPAREYGAMSLTCSTIHKRVFGGTCRAMHLSSRIMRHEENYETTKNGGKRATNGSICQVSGLALCGGRKEAMELLQRSLIGKFGCTNRLVGTNNKKKKKTTDTTIEENNEYDDASNGDEYPGYARFIEEATIGHSAIQCTRHGTFPTYLQGRFASCSPEHSLLRLGGGASSGPGGSGCASWGIGKRGQLGHGKRDDIEQPKLLLGKIGWGVRIVQVSAGGGLVRVAHSLLLTSTGRVLSFGQNSYGQLGHGYDAGNVLSDCLRPRYIEGPLKNVKCICVSAGELHSGAVTIDGDVYTWGEGFCGQLGLGDRRPHLLPEQVTLGGLDTECVSNMSCGCRHTLVTTEEGEVFSWGLGRFGVLGRSYTDFTYQTDVGMVLPDGEEEGNVQGVAVRPPPPPINIPAEVYDAAAVMANQEGFNLEAVNISLEALNLTLDDPSDQCYPNVIDSLKGIRAVGVSAGHRHSLVLDEHGGLYSFGSGASGALGHADLVGQEFPVKIEEFDKLGVSVHQMSAGVDISMAVSTEGIVYAWGKAADGRLGLGIGNRSIKIPHPVEFADINFKAVDVECGYVHSLIVGLDGSVWQCGGVGTDGKEDGQQDLHSVHGKLGHPEILLGYNVWHRIAEPKEEIVKQKWEVSCVVVRWTCAT
jgi:E3 ubiquitin-protein ligase HERC2